MLLDVDNLIDYMLVILYSGNLDAPISAFLGNEAVNNFYAIRDRTARQGFRFLAHDSEHTLLNVFEDRTGPFPAGEQFQHFNPQWLHQRLSENAEYRLRFADHVRRHFFNGGALTPEAATARFLQRVEEVRPAILGESARWGDSKVVTPYTIDTWQAAVDNILANFLPGRSAVVLQQLIDDGLFPAVEAPSFLVNGLPSRGGQVTAGSELRLLAPAGLVYYTLDGTDPRLFGGAINPAALTYDPGITATTLIATGSVWNYLDDGSDPGTAWRDAGFDDSTWSSGPAELGYGDGDEATTISFGPDDQNKFITTYFRRTFDAGSLAGLVGLTLRLKRDDGAVVYLNGVEVARSNMPGGPVTSTTLASGNVTDADESTFLNIPLDPGALLAGANVLAVEVHQSLPNSSDTSFDLELIALASTAPAIPLNATATFTARVLDAGVWSAIDAVTFLVNDPATAANLAITEIEYNPHAPEGDELAVDKEDYEFIELRNIGPREIDLTGVRFTAGITFDFTGSATTFLAPGAFVVLVKNPAAFASRYGAVANVVGPYDGNLSNGGERIVLIDASDAVIRDFTYDDAAPWPTSPDGGGMTLNVIDTTGDLSSPANWRASLERGGSPGFPGNTAPTIAGPPPTTINEDTTRTVAFVVGDAETAIGSLVVTVAADNLVLVPAAGLVLAGTGADRTLTITPAADCHGSATITLTVDDGAGGGTTASFVLTVRPVNDPPAAVDRNLALDEDATLGIAAPGLLTGAIDRDGDFLTTAVVDLPDHGTVDVRPDGPFTYTPAPDFHGDDSFTYTVNDGTAPSAPATVRITIASVPDAPELPPIADRPAPEEALLNFLITATDADGPTDLLTYTLDPGAPAGAQIDAESGLFSWTPAEADGPGTFAITVRVTDSSTPALSATRSFTVHVAEANRAPTLAPIANRTVAEEIPVTFTVQATDPDLPANPLTYSLDAGAPAGAQIYADTGVFSWTPTEADGPGTFPITVRVTDSALSATQTFTVNVTEANRAPTLAPIAHRTVAEGTLVTFTAQATDPDLPANPLTYILDPGAPAGAQINANTGVFSWTPTEADGPGSFAITVRVTDSALSSTQTFTVNVTEVNRAPTLAPLAEVVAVEGTLVTFTAQATDPDLPANRLTYSLGAGAPAGMTIDSASGVVRWTPDDSRPLPVIFVIQVADNAAPARTHARFVAIRVVNAAPTVAPLADLTAPQGVPIVHVGSFTDPGAEAWGATVDYGDGAGPQPLGLNPDKTFRLEHAYAATGTFRVTVSVTDRDGAVGSRSFAVQVLDTTGPRIAAVQPVTRRQKLNAVVVTFDEPIAPGLATLPSAYRLVSAGRDRRFGTRDDGVVRLRPPSYNPATGQVLLSLRRPQPKNQPYQLTIPNGLLADLAGNRLDGDGDGRPGGDAIHRLGPAPRPAVAARAVDQLSAADNLPGALRRRPSPRR